MYKSHVNEDTQDDERNKKERRKRKTCENSLFQEKKSGPVDRVSVSAHGLHILSKTLI